MRETKRGGKRTNTGSLKIFLKEQETFLAHMNHEVVEDELVKMGSVDDSHLIDKSEPKKKSRKRARLN